ncbi:conserved hypothetical protein [Coccidioides posadasii C735 delta SOWgp]|uniref:Uncharacterized protein n=1 Tax=Coccidioides posadasii (strain C735) TaxID=222929 RepID=C5P969_COCP7|nr:conserved hypothetical protein [Coccidioides posadasii C735 delta SOWgp]EER26281.1 conserved hypothetical protein [Coccidioides posadasii C735 delta SOWgp]|eukprot:XP_003068426.1 conserved hypothetical protein [Coccidioides posadasii C735 delta SOWgp]
MKGYISDGSSGSPLFHIQGHGSSGWGKWSPSMLLVMSSSFSSPVIISGRGKITDKQEPQKTLSFVVNSVVFSNDGQRHASGSNDRTVKIWDPTSGDCLQTLFVGRTVGRLSFDLTDIFRLSTEIGAFHLDYHSATAKSDSEKAAPYDSIRSSYGISTNGIWIVNNGQNVLWLPPQSRPETFTVADSTVAIGCRSGCLLVMRFQRM